MNIFYLYFLLEKTFFILKMQVGIWIWMVEDKYTAAASRVVLQAQTLLYTHIGWAADLLKAGLIIIELICLLNECYSFPFTSSELSLCQLKYILFYQIREKTVNMTVRWPTYFITQTVTLINVVLCRTEVISVRLLFLVKSW